MNGSAGADFGSGQGGSLAPNFADEGSNGHQLMRGQGQQSGAARELDPVEMQGLGSMEGSPGEDANEADGIGHTGRHRRRWTWLQRIGLRRRNAGTRNSSTGGEGGVPEEGGGSQQQRVVHVGDPARPAEGQQLAGNRIRTSKYTIVTFLPRNLFEQFHRIAYLYFLVLVILNQIPVLSAFGRTASLFPLLLVLIVTALKDGYEDWERHRADRVENARESLVRSQEGGQFVPKKWASIAVGELLKLHNNDTVPCDLVLLATSDPEGRAYIETLNLDGESSLKTRRCLAATQQARAEGVAADGRIVCELPNRNIYDFSGYMDVGGQRYALGAANMILRGAEVRNTGWLVGCVVYAGAETKAMLNSSGAQSKRSRLERHMNREVVILAAVLIFMCSVGAIGMGLWLSSNPVHELPFYGAQNSYHGVGGEAIINWLSLLIVFQIMVPISLYISLELVRLGQSFFMRVDLAMWHEPTRTSLQCRALNINEDLGQVRYVFSDKTGTLTENRMEFHACSILGTNYDSQEIAPRTGDEEAEISVAQQGPESQSLLNGLPLKWKPKAGAKVDAALVRALQAAPPPSARTLAAGGGLYDFFLVLAVCNSVVPTKLSRSVTGEVGMRAATAEEGGWVEYQGESPDEQALVTAAAAYGFSLLERSTSYVVLTALDEIRRYDVLGVHEFDSVRKRMSVVVRGPDGRVLLLLKGADSAVLHLCRAAQGAAERSCLEGTERDLDAYAREGLRTLVVAARELPPAEVQRWAAAYETASTAILERGDKVGALAESVERELQLLGATGIEDRLQQGVPATIALLRQAGCKVWVLTGDKQETAISIAYSAGLITRAMRTIVINEATVEGVSRALDDASSAFVRNRRSGSSRSAPRGSLLRRFVSLFRGNGSEAEADMATLEGGREAADSRLPSPAGAGPGGFQPLRQSARAAESAPLALVIDGAALLHALHSDLEQQLYELATACRVVICCRVAPLQKAGIVSLVKGRSKELTLAIGDGANDVSMIQMADVGVGISGQEGRQAVMASDFAIAQFRFLGRLLLVHGHWNYQRLAYMILYNFYRNAVFVLMLFWFTLYTAYSPQTGLSDWSLVLFSVIYTSVPTIAVGILEQDLRPETLASLPALYGAGLRGESYNAGLFWLMLLDTVWQSLVLFFVPFFTALHSDYGLWEVGQVWTFGVVIVVNLHLAMDVRHWTWIHHVVIWLSIVVTFCVLLILDTGVSTPQYKAMVHAIGQGWYWLDLLLITVLALMPRFIVKAVVQRYAPNDIQVAYEVELLGRVRSSDPVPMEMSEVAHTIESPKA